MQIAIATGSDHAWFRNLVNAEIRPDHAKTNAWDDFPLILDPANAPWTLIARTEDGTPAAAMAALIRTHTTSFGEMAIAGLGSVVTRPEFRGQGLSRSLQIAMLERLRRQDVPLAVLWTDQPEIYAGRGFAAAGWEHHVDLGEVSWPPPPQLEIRACTAADAPAVGALQAGHPWRTLRRPGDDARLYGMPGTRGLAAVGPDGRILAAVFCGKGADFPGYVVEWSGDPEAVLAVLAEARRRGLADAVLIPAGGEHLLERLAALGAAWAVRPSGQWCVLRPDLLQAAAAGRGLVAPAAPAEDAAAWLGAPDGRGGVVPGPLAVAIWGFDSV